MLGPTYMLPDGEGLGEVDVHAQGPIPVVLGHLLVISKAYERAPGIRTPLTGFAPNSSGNMPKRRSSPWQLGARWSAAPTSSANSDRSKSWGIVLAEPNVVDFLHLYSTGSGVAHRHLVALSPQPDSCHEAANTFDCQRVPFSSTGYCSTSDLPAPTIKIFRG